jgi:hypothetical protein
MPLYRTVENFNKFGCLLTVNRHQGKDHVGRFTTSDSIKKRSSSKSSDLSIGRYPGSIEYLYGTSCVGGMGFHVVGQKPTIGIHFMHNPLDSTTKSRLGEIH